MTNRHVQPLTAGVFAVAIVFQLAVSVTLAASPEQRRAVPLPATKVPPAPTPAQPATASLPTPPPAVPQAPPTRRDPEAERRPAAGTFEGAYSVEGTSEEVRVRRLLDDVYLLTSTVGWEGVGILEGTIYRGVFRSRGAPDVPAGAMGEHIIDWTTPENPSMQATYKSLRVGDLAQRWRRLPDSQKPAREKPAPIVVAPPESGAPPGRRPEFGEYVYVEELPEVVTKVMPAYPEEAMAGIEGTVQVQALVLEDGTVGDCRIVSSVPGLDEAAVAAVRRWRFKPAMAKGVPVAVWVAVPVRFRLQH